MIPYSYVAQIQSNSFCKIINVSSSLDLNDIQVSQEGKAEILTPQLLKSVKSRINPYIFKSSENKALASDFPLIKSYFSRQEILYLGNLDEIKCIHGGAVSVAYH
ncbi:hypothetical protein NIES3974_44600 [Calothrix sp. NIES-3974]|nr:hypothetical protein NIES3974_44600 [Calothrix sp. NIES-3974]